MGEEKAKTLKEKLLTQQPGRTRYEEVSIDGETAYLCALTVEEWFKIQRACTRSDGTTDETRMTVCQVMAALKDAPPPKGACVLGLWSKSDDFLAAVHGLELGVLAQLYGRLGALMGLTDGSRVAFTEAAPAASSES